MFDKTFSKEERTLRDDFAIKVLSGMLARHGGRNRVDTVKAAYEFAELMILERRSRGKKVRELEERV